jgi:hypothetical protein
MNTTTPMSASQVYFRHDHKTNNKEPNVDALRSKITSAIEDSTTKDRIFVRGDIRQDEHQKRITDIDEERQTTDTEHFDCSENNDRIKEKDQSGIQNKNPKARKLFIEKGKERVCRSRRNEGEVSNLESFSIDDGSYIDDLRMSILAEDWENDPRNYQSKARKHQRQKQQNSETPKWEDLQAKLLKTLGSNDSDDMHLRSIILDVAGGKNMNKNNGVTSSKTTRIKQSKRGGKTLSDSVEVPRGQKVKPKMQEENPRSRLEVQKLPNIEDYSEQGRPSAGLLSVETPEKMARRRSPMSPPSNQPVMTTRQIGKVQVSQIQMKAPVVIDSNEEGSKHRTQERLKYLKSWLREKEEKHELRTPFTPSKPAVETDLTEKVGPQIFLKTLKQTSKDDSYHSAPSLDEDRGHKTRIQHRQPTNSSGIEVSLFESMSELTTRSSQSKESLQEVVEHMDQMNNPTRDLTGSPKPALKPFASKRPLEALIQPSDSASDRTRDLLSRSRTLLGKSTFDHSKPKVAEYSVSPGSHSREVVLSASSSPSKKAEMLSSDTLASRGFSIAKKAEMLNDDTNYRSRRTRYLPTSMKHKESTKTQLTDKAAVKLPKEFRDLVNDVETTQSMKSERRDNPILEFKTPILDIEALRSAPKLRKSSRAFMNPDGDNSVDLSISFKNENSFESTDLVKKTDLPLWRMDPLESFSDFIIQIQNKQSGEMSVYHVHRQILAFGKRRSKHLDSIFCSSTVCSTHFVLDSKVVDYFPLVLDFLYCHDYELELTTENALAYRSIANTFQVTSLMAEATHFIEQDIQLSNMPTYVAEVDEYKDYKLRKLIQVRCAESIGQISEMDSLWILMDPDLFWGTVSCPLVDRDKTSPYLSILVKEYTSLHMHEMNEAMFGDLTSPSILPTIDRQAALPLLEICFSYGSPKAFQPLQERCAHTIASYWKITSPTDRQRLFALLRSLPSSFTVDFLEKVETGKTNSVINTSRRQGSKKSVGCATKNQDNITESFTFESIYVDFGDNDHCEDENDNKAVKAIRNNCLSWRVKPALSYSDWKIRIKHEKSGRIDVYNVHKHIMAVGDYKSSYFSGTFLNDESQQQQLLTTVELNSAAAELFPQVLDFLYSKNHTIRLSTKIALPLRFLARALRVWMLNEEIIEFVRQDMSMDNILRYIDDSDAFNDEIITEMAIQFCTANITTFDLDSPFLRDLKAGFFGRVVNSTSIASSASCHATILTVKYFLIHNLDEMLLEDILMKQSDTMEEGLDCLNALRLLQLVSTLKERKNSDFFKSLKSRCTEVLKQNWSELRESFRNELFVLFQTLDTETVAMLFDKVEETYYEKVFNTMDEQSKLLNDYQSQLVGVKGKHEAEVTKVKKEMEEKVQKIASKKEVLEKELKQKDKLDAKLAKKSIPMIIGALSSLSVDTNLKSKVETESSRCAMGWCGP